MKGFWNRRVSLVRLAMVLVLIVGIFGLLNKRMNDDIARRSAQVKRLGSWVARGEREETALNAKIKAAHADEFIADEARTRYGYLSPGEIRFVVANIEALFAPDPVPQELLVRRVQLNFSAPDENRVVLPPVPDAQPLDLPPSAQGEQGPAPVENP